ncbi:MAG: hypothetical protein LLG43_05245 [Deltaproteobacteria bacterium]|nr:hypothetical protein [Deltaproteobacteria bacterium]
MFTQGHAPGGGKPVPGRLMRFRQEPPQSTGPKGDMVFPVNGQSEKTVPDQIGLLRGEDRFDRAKRNVKFKKNGQWVEERTMRELKTQKRCHPRESGGPEVLEKNGFPLS